MAESRSEDSDDQGYHLMRSYHDKAYRVISEALDLDELAASRF